MTRLTIRERLCQMLIDEGYTRNFDNTDQFTAKNISGVRGWNRVRALRDDEILVWEAYAMKDDGKSVHLVSWDTMTDCVRSGFTISEEFMIHYVTAKSQKYREYAREGKDQTETRRCSFLG